MTTFKTSTRPIAQGEQITILAVDDNPTVLQLLCSWLEQANYAVIEARNGKEAMAALYKSPKEIDAVLLDRMMPVMDGMEVTRTILADPDLRFTPIVMQTAADKPEEISEGIEAGVFYYLTKPLERKTMLSVVSAAAKEFRQRKALQAEMQRHRMSFGLMEEIRSSCQTLDEAESLASFLANCFPDPERALTGLSELLVNAVEHGNLCISYDEKTRLVDSNSWRTEVDRRQQLPEYADRKVRVRYERKDGLHTLQITDQGQGFNWKHYLELDSTRASHNHGRGIAMANKLAFNRLEYNPKGNRVTAFMQPDKQKSG